MSKLIELLEHLDYQCLQGNTDIEIKDIVYKLRTAIPDICLRTTLITGFPGETQEDHESLLSFVDDMEFDRLGVFPYSPEEGTPAEKMERVDEDTANRRAEQIMELQYAVMEEFNAKRMGSEVKVLCEGYDEEKECFFGRSFAESPDIDGRILFTGDDVVIDSFCTVKITDEDDGELAGRKIG